MPERKLISSSIQSPLLSISPPSPVISKVKILLDSENPFMDSSGSRPIVFTHLSPDSTSTKFFADDPPMMSQFSPLQESHPKDHNVYPNHISNDSSSITTILTHKLPSFGFNLPDILCNYDVKFWSRPVWGGSIKPRLLQSKGQILLGLLQVHSAERGYCSSNNWLPANYLPCRLTVEVDSKLLVRQEK